jgi:hypothetical protein
MKEKSRLWVARLLIGLVTGWNLQAALIFILWPERYAPGFELTGVPGSAAVRGTGILFLMWNAPYLLALWHPHKYRRELGLALAMQFIGLAGESSILITLPLGHALLRTSIARFIAFDASGLALLAVAFWLSNYNVARKQVW